MIYCDNNNILDALRLRRAAFSKAVHSYNGKYGNSLENLEKHIQERLPLEYQNCMTGIDRVIRMACDITEKPIDDKTRLQALLLLNECYKYKMDLTTNGVVITDAIKFVQTNKERLAMSTKEVNGSKESKEPDYDEDKEQLEGEQEKETENQEITNQVF